MEGGTGQKEEKKEKEKEEKEEKKEEKKFLHTGGQTDQSKVVQEVLADLKILREETKVSEKAKGI